MQNDGIKTEQQIIGAINGKLYSQLTPFMQHVVKKSFPAVDDSEPIVARKWYIHAKADIIIEFKGERKYISIKSGRAEVVHEEPIGSFIEFIRAHGISERTIETILLFQYGDGTTDGTGKVRKGYAEISEELSDRLAEANKEMFKYDLVIDTLERCLFGTNDKYNDGVDFILFGCPNYGVFVSREDVLRYAMRRTYGGYISPHIGPLLIQPFMRDVEFKSQNQYKRDMVKIKWPRLLNDLEYLERKYSV